NQAGGDSRASDVPGAEGRDGAGSAPRADPRPYAGLAALSRPQPLGEARMARHLQGPEADLVPAAPGRARLRRLVARLGPSRIRRVALARLLGAARHGDRLQARRVPASPGAARGLPRRAPVAGGLVALRPPPQA